MATILRDAGLSDLAPGADLERLADGFQFTEGPLWDPDGSLLFQDIKAERTYKIKADGSLSMIRDRTGAGNGQTFAPGGRIVLCEQNGRRVSSMAIDGTDVKTAAETWAGQRLNSPNDIVARSDGLLYFTDPPYGVPARDRALHFQGVYALDLDADLTTPARTRLLADDFEKPNGLALSPDEKTLYVCDTARYHVRAFVVEPDGRLRPSSGRVFARFDPGEPGGPDGMKVDREGRLYVAVALGIWVYDPSGRFLGILATPRRPSNLAWCGREANHLAITAVDAVYRIRLNTTGVLPPFTP